MADNVIERIDDDGNTEYHVQYVVGDTLPSLEGILEEVSGVGYTVSLLVERANGSNLEKTAAVTTGASGGASFVVSWAASDLVAGDDQRCLLKVTDASGGITTYKGIYLDVSPGITVA